MKIELKFEFETDEGMPDYWIRAEFAKLKAAVDALQIPRDPNVEKQLKGQK